MQCRSSVAAQSPAAARRRHWPDDTPGDRPMPLNTAPNLAHPDEFYEALIEMHHDLDDAESQASTRD
jgi:hypothetical protein